MLGAVARKQIRPLEPYFTKDPLRFAPRKAIQKHLTAAVFADLLNMEAGLVIFVSWTQSFEVAVFSDYAFQTLENTVDGLPLTHEPPYRPRSRSWIAVSFWVTRSLESRRCALQDVAWPSRDLGAEDRCIRASSSGLNRLSCMFRLGLWLLSAGVAVIQ